MIPPGKHPPGLLAETACGDVRCGSEACRESRDVCFRKSYLPECQEVLRYPGKVAGIFPSIACEEIPNVK